MSQVQTLNYSTHAIEDLTLLADRVKPRLPETGKALSRIVELLRESEKFILPNCCDIFEPQKFQQQHLDLLHIPYKICAFEAPWIMAGNNTLALDGSLIEVKSTKRIALAIELSANNRVSGFENYNEQFLQKFPQGGVYVISIFWQEQTGWETLMGGLFVPYQNVMIKISHGDVEEGGSALKTMKEAGRLSGCYSKLQAEPFVLLPELFEQNAKKIGLKQAFEQTLLDGHDEVSCVIQACAVLNCENIQTEKIEPAVKLNHKRRKNNKEPFFSYRVLQIRENTSSKTSGGGTHRSPKTHLRRGHIRRIGEKSTWIRSAMVNANSKDGKVVKEYKVG